MSPKTEKVFYVLSFLVHGSSYMSPRTYGIMHRLHHQYTDSSLDPHSPAYHPGFWAMMWQTRNSYHNIHTERTIVEDKYTRDLPKWNSFELFAHNWLTRLVWILLYTLFYVLFATHWWMYLLLPFTIIMCTLQGTLINWWAHKYGYVNYPMNNLSKNIIPFDILFIGDAYHNNHHRYPGRSKNAHRWFEIDLIYYITCMLARLKIVHWKNTRGEIE